jgi:spore coat protein CotF
MPFGAHETMETHEILMEKINCISHFNLYARQTKNPQLRDMIVRHQQEEIRSYNELVAYTHDYNEFRPIPPNTDIRGITPQQIQYGLNNPPPIGPEADASFNDREIGIAMLLSHKNGARNCTWASLECADPNLRRMMLNGAATCINQAYEVFLFMNQQGLYQVPTLNDHTAKTFMHSYQPAGEALQNQYAMPQAFGGGGQTQSFARNAQQEASPGNGQQQVFSGNGQQQSFAGNSQQLRGNPGVYDGSRMSGLNTGSRDSVLYGAGQNG